MSHVTAGNPYWEIYTGGKSRRKYVFDDRARSESRAAQPVDTASWTLYTGSPKVQKQNTYRRYWSAPKKADKSRSLLSDETFLETLGPVDDADFDDTENPYWVISSYSGKRGKVHRRSTLQGQFAASANDPSPARPTTR